MKNNTNEDNDLVKFAVAFERYVFGQRFVLESESWQDAEEKIKDFLAARKARDGVALYYEVDRTLWREYQFLFLCQIIEFTLAELIGRLHGAGSLKAEFIAELQNHSKADPERAREVSRLTSPAALLEDFGFGLGRLVKIVEDKTLPFEQRDSVLEELKSFNRDRVKFIHHSFGGKENAGTEIADALRSGKLLLKRLEALMGVYR